MFGHEFQIHDRVNELLKLLGYILHSNNLFQIKKLLNYQFKKSSKCKRNCAKHI
jgi:hypothetical protein